jgi:chemotaxis protein MotA
MFAIIGMVLVIVSILGGYLIEKGHVLVLMQPAELLIIGGAGLGTLLIANPLPILKGIISNLQLVLKGTPYSEKAYEEALGMLNELFQVARREGPAKLEEHIEEPAKSLIFKKYPTFATDHFAVDYVCDTLRMSLAGSVTPMDLEMLMESDAEVHHHEAGLPAAALSSVADSLPGLGIVAAVLGVVITMGAMSGPPEEIGSKVAAALVGTFLGILLCYGFVGPLAANITKINDEANAYYRVLRQGVAGYLKGMPPILAAESARRMVPVHVRPTMKEMEASFKQAKSGGEGKGSAEGKGPAEIKGAA